MIVCWKRYSIYIISESTGVGSYIKCIYLYNKETDAIKTAPAEISAILLIRIFFFCQIRGSGKKLCIIFQPTFVTIFPGFAIRSLRNTLTTLGPGRARVILPCSKLPCCGLEEQALPASLSSNRPPAL